VAWATRVELEIDTLARYVARLAEMSCAAVVWSWGVVRLTSCDINLRDPR